MTARTAILLFLIAAHPARAEFPVAADLGLRVAYAFPFGEVAGVHAPQPGLSNLQLSDLTSGQVPVWLDLGVRLYQRFSTGLFVSLGPAFSRCVTDAHCDALEFRIGLQGSIHLFPRGRFDPWASIGVGYEHLQESQSSVTTPGSPTNNSGLVLGLDGFEALVHLGFDYRISRHFGLGPFLAFAIGEYVHQGMTFNGVQRGTSIDDRAVHEWLLLGARFLWTS